MAQLSEKLSKGIAATPFKNRPLAFILAAFLCAMFFIRISMPLFIAYAVAVVLYSLKIAVFNGGFKIRKNPMVYLLPIVLIFAVLFNLRDAYSYDVLKDMHGQRTVKAVVEDTYYEERFGSRYLVRLVLADGRSVSGYATLEFDYDASLDEFDTVSATVTVSDAREGLEGSELLQAKSNFIIAEMECIELTGVTNEAKHGVVFRASRFAQSLREHLYSRLSPNTAGYASAILLGNKSGVTHDFYRDMAALGSSHILAVSGMHLSIIAAIVSFFAEKIRSSRKIKSLMIIGTAIGFTMLAGFSVSVIRAAIMLTVAMLSVFVRGRHDPITTLMISGALITAVSPESVISCGFLLSFSATLGIVVCALYAEQGARARLYSSRVGDMRAPYRLIRKLLFSLMVSLCATLFTAPVMALYFSEISFVSVFSNLISIPMAFISMIFTLLALLLGGAPYIGNAICVVFDKIYGGFAWAVDVVSDIFTTTVSLRYPFLVPCLILLAAILVYMFNMRVRNPIALVGAMVSVALVFGGAVQIYRMVNSDRVEVAYVAEPNSEGIVLSSGSDTLYIDIGNGSKKVPQTCVALAKNEYYETELDGYMLTHYHQRHIATLVKVMRDTEIKSIYLPKPQNQSEQQIFDSIVSVAGSAMIIQYERGEEVKFGKARIETLSYALLERSEHPVIALKIQSERASVAYIGASVSESSENARIERFISECGAVICGAHGPVVKEQDPFISFSGNKAVYLSPYEEIDEALVFPNGKYVTEKADESGISVTRLLLCD